MALAWDGVVNGTIRELHVTGGNNYGVRVVLHGVEKPCTGAGAPWAYLNESDSNYKVYVAMLMMAKAKDSEILVHSNLVDGHCRIGYLTVR